MNNSRIHSPSHSREIFLLKMKNHPLWTSVRSAALTLLGSATLLALSLGGQASAASLSDPQVDSYNVRVGTETFSALYQFTTNALLVETAQAITNLGSDTLKCYLGSDSWVKNGIPLPGNITTLLGLVRDEPNYHKVLDMPFRHFIMWTYALENSDAWWQSGYNTTKGAKDYNEIYALTQYLLTNYNNSGKTFYLGHWEGDGYLKINNWTTNPPASYVQGMIGWLNNRQKAVDDAKNATPHSNVSVYHYSEVNRVRDAMVNGSNNNVRVINAVIPYVTNLDYLSYSSYDAQNLTTNLLYATLDYMQASLPTNKAGLVPGCRMWVGEYGWGYFPTSQQESTNRAYIQKLLGWSSGGQCLQYILYWEMYNNEPVSSNYCLIDFSGARVPSYYLHQRFINQSKLLVGQFKESNGRLPSDTEFSALASPMLNQTLPAPVSLTVDNQGIPVAANGSAQVSGTIAQGIYGDDCASVRVYWGRQDGGTNRTLWESSRLVGLNTNFNPATFTTQLTNLSPLTGYFYRFYATNASGEAWAPTSDQFYSGGVIGSLDPQSFGSRLKINISGYTRNELLTNFPLLVSLSTNCPGFSYRQFASPTGGDLRFTDSDGVSQIPYEIDEWNTNGLSSVWVQIPVLSPTNDFIWAYWGNPSLVPQPAWTTNGAAWSPDFDLVWHLRESAFPYADSSQQYPALSGVAPGSTQSGVIGHGGLFDGITNCLNAGPVSLGRAFTLSAWIKINVSSMQENTLFANKNGGWIDSGFSFFVNTWNHGDGVVEFDSVGTPTTQTSSAVTSAGAVSFGQWHLVTAAVDATANSVRLYVDGIDRTVTSGVGAGMQTTNTVRVGSHLSNGCYVNGALDEARIETGVRSANWVWASYMSAASNSTFSVSSPVTRLAPPLSALIGAGNLVLSWPGAGVGFTVYSATNLAPPVVWSPATNLPVFVNNQWQVVLPNSARPSQFYRVQSQ